MATMIAAGLLSPSVGLIFWITLTFLLLLFVLRKYAWGPITRALSEREQKIDASIKSAEKALAEAKQIQADNQKARLEAEQEAQKVMREAREAAERLRNEELDKTRSKIAQLQEQAESQIEMEKDRALTELRKEVADLAIKAAEKILSENVDENRQRRLVEGFLDDLRSN